MVPPFGRIFVRTNLLLIPWLHLFWVRLLRARCGSYRMRGLNVSGSAVIDLISLRINLFLMELDNLRRTVPIVFWHVRLLEEDDSPRIFGLWTGFLWDKVLCFSYFLKIFMNLRFCLKKKCVPWFSYHRILIVKR